jgi:hypothetical protein
MADSFLSLAIMYLLTGSEKTITDVIASRFSRTAFWASVAKQSPIKRREALKFGIFPSKRRLLRREKHPPRNDMPAFELGVSRYVIIPEKMFYL